MLKWLDNKLPKGFYFPFMTEIIKQLRNVSLNYRTGKHVREKIAQNQKTSPWVSELLQCIFLVLGLLAFTSSEWINYEYSSWIIIGFSSYRIFEISVFILNWIFVAREEELLHSYRRSIAGFLLNIVEVAIYFSIITIWSGGLKDSTKLDIFYKHIVGILTLSPPDIECTILSFGEIFVSVLLILVVLGALVGGLTREEVGDEKKQNDKGSSRESQ